MCMNKRKAALVLSLIIVFLVVMTGCGSSKGSDSKGQKEAKKIKVGVVNALTGPQATAGISIVNGAKIAFEKINSQGGVTISGEKYLLDPVIQDDRGDAKESVAIFEKMIGDGIKFFNGPLPSSSSIAVGPIIQKNKVIDINQSLSVEASKWPYSFSSHIDGSQTDFVGTYLFKKLGLKKIAVLTTQNDFGITLANSLKKGYTAAGGQILTEEFFSLNDKDFYTQLTKIKNMKPDGLFVAGYGDACALTFKQAHELNVAPVVAGQSALTAADILRLVNKEDVQGMYDFSQMDLGNSVTAKVPEAEKFLAEYQAKFGKDAPNGASLFGYDGIMFLAEGLTRANSTDTSKVRDVLEGLNPPDSTWKWQPIRKYYDQKGKLFSDIHKVSLQWEVRQFKGDDYQFVGWLEK